MELNGEFVRQLYNDVTSRKSRAANPPKMDLGNGSHPFPGKPPCLKSFYGFFATVDESFPDYKLLMDNIVVQGNKVMAQYTISGTQKGNFMGLDSTDVKVTITGIDVFRVDKGKIVEYWDSAHQITVCKKIRNCLSRQQSENPITYLKKQPTFSA